ncbi:hypothetical protein TELCIR_23058 [Teladorsagia circumcincta]|uniref:Cytoplasmic tRNA 2-thiolation protein 1 C-terminal domain-containing protein n=1 Tax=Teladorsagia circumcincta TaxID=45464 RepID=A0A2G9TC82_TELCI|nr:hypothetical protein TELCIR_23058 [Teladorsagia circumcincta]
MYARLNKLDYFYTECIYAPDSYRAYSRTFIKDLERLRPESILALIKSGESVVVKTEVAMPTLINCTRCGYICSQSICKACLLLEGLNTGCTDLGIKRKTKKIAIVEEENPQTGCSGGCDCDDNVTTSF